MPKWVQSFSVPSSSGHGEYTVSLADDGSYGCSCPHWKFRRQPCRHIATVQEQASTNHTGTAYRRPLPICRSANVPEVQKLNEDTLLVPLIPLKNAHFLATVIVDLLTHGIPFEEIKRRYHLSAKYSRSSYTQLILSHGRCIYGDLDPRTKSRSLITTSIWNLPDPILPGETAARYEARTGCPQDLFHIALQNTPPIKESSTAPHTRPEHPAPRRPHHRRILTS